MGKSKPQLDICHQQIKPPTVPKMSYIQFSSWPKGPHGNLPTSQTNEKTAGCTPQTDVKTLLLETIPIRLTEDEEIKLVPN